MSAAAPTRGAEAEAGAGARLADLYEAHSRMVVGLCRLLLRDPDEAEDAAQQSFLSAYRSMLSGTKPRKPGPWLAQIARNECMGRAQRSARGPVAVADLEPPQPDGLDTAELVERRSQMEDVTAAIAALPDRQREAVLLRDFYGLSYREVASALTVSVPIVESLLFRARRRLKATVGGAPQLTHTAWLVPAALHAQLAGLVPGFGSPAAAAATGSGVGAGAGLASLPKLTSLPGAGAAKFAALPFGGKIAAGALASTVAVGAAAGPPIAEQISRSGSPPAQTARTTAAYGSQPALTTGPRPGSADTTTPRHSPPARRPSTDLPPEPADRDDTENSTEDNSRPADGVRGRGRNGHGPDRDDTTDDHNKSGPGQGERDRNDSENRGPGSKSRGSDDDSNPESSNGGPGHTGDHDEDETAGRSAPGGKDHASQHAGETGEYSSKGHNDENDDDDSPSSGPGGNSESSDHDRSDPDDD